MAKKKKRCPHCGEEFSEFQNPILTVDIIIEIENRGIVLIKRKNYPLGWALPGGFVDYGETVEEAAMREAREETSLTLDSMQQFRVYSEPSRDPRQHTVSVVFTARASEEPRANDDAAEVGLFSRETLPVPIVFDHKKIIDDYFVAKDEQGQTG
jgi:ADP-ribose pyrophosphatase YjhB (NUDIX family)